MNKTVCNNCGNFFDPSFTHVCFGRGNVTYAPNPIGERPGAAAATFPLLTEARIREIVREEIAAAGIEGEKL